MGRITNTRLYVVAIPIQVENQRFDNELTLVDAKYCGRDRGLLVSLLFFFQD
jgi:hypothetical protein